jgi:hypothetical protein
MSEGSIPGEGEQEEIKAPFSFKLMIALTVIYLGWRLIQAVAWLVDKLS